MNDQSSSLGLCRLGGNRQAGTATDALELGKGGSDLDGGHRTRAEGVA